MPKQKVFLTRSDYPKNGVSLLEPRYELSFWDHEKNGVITKEGMVANVKGVNAIFCCLNDKIDKDVIEAAGDSLKIVSTMSVGVDHVDREILKKKNVKLGYTPDVLTEATAELTVALLLATSRRLLEANKLIREGHWTSPWAPVWMCGPALKGSTVGIVGFGRIGQSTAIKLKAFDVGKILYGSEKEKPEGIEMGACRASLDVLLKESDFVIATCALSEKTKGLFSKENFEKMKPTSIFINTSRGGVVDQEALIDALKNGKIRAAGLDVMTPEPLPADHPLLCLDNCVILPHIGSATYQTRMVMSDLVAKNIIAALEGKEMPAEYK
ncbi:glyoxylate reductase/hydroxypyruvate reductase-like isoform X2 [Cimex lectularius]|nr:glyoxylate reductase/hydroxypyruvate reductase-like isoform X2 [Cimex lectularius]XP_014239499.1 glyoxylate reductase/hydroxypyruvate reductase-like isoform X2 [Cimex lectularius]